MKPDVTMKINLLLQMGIAHGRSLNYPEGGPLVYFCIEQEFPHGRDTTGG